MEKRSTVERGAADGAWFSGLDGWGWALFFARWVLGLTFFMAGLWKCFELGAVAHARGFFVEGFADSWIPAWLLWVLGWTIPWLELVAGGMLCLGLGKRWASIALGAVLVAVTYGHLLQEPLYSLQAHIFIRLALLLFVLAGPEERDLLSVDAWLAGRRRVAGARPGS